MTLYDAPDGAFCVVIHVSVLLPPDEATVALLACAPLRQPQGVVQSSSCCAQVVVVAVTFCWKAP